MDGTRTPFIFKPEVGSGLEVDSGPNLNETPNRRLPSCQGSGSPSLGRGRVKDFAICEDGPRVLVTSGDITTDRGVVSINVGRLRF